MMLTTKPPRLNPLAQETKRACINKLPVHKNVFPKENRLKSQLDFSHLKKHGKLIKTPFFFASYESSPDKKLRIGIICAKKKIALSVKRNRAKRLLREAVRANIRSFPPIHLVLIAREAILGINSNRVSLEIGKILTKIEHEKN